MRAGEAGEFSVRGTSEDRPLNARGDDVERDTQVPEVQPAAEARAGDGQLARRALDRRALPRARHQREPVAQVARAGAGGRDGALRGWRAALPRRRAAQEDRRARTRIGAQDLRAGDRGKALAGLGVGMRVTRSRELVAEGYRPSAVARVAQISRQAIYRVPQPQRAPASPSRPPACEVEAAIVAEAEANPTDGYRMVTAWARRRLGRPVNRKRVLRVMRERRLIQRRRPSGRRRRPGFFRVERPDQLWHLDMTSVWGPEHGWVYLMAALDCTREITARHLETRCRATEAIGLIERGGRRARHRARDADARHRQRLGVHRARLQDRPERPRDRASARRLPRSREPGVHRVLVRQAQKNAASGAEFETLEQAHQAIGTYVTNYHHRPHSRLNYNTPLKLAATWRNGQDHLTQAA